MGNKILTNRKLNKMIQKIILQNVKFIEVQNSNFFHGQRKYQLERTPIEWQMRFDLGLKIDNEIRQINCLMRFTSGIKHETHPEFEKMLVDIIYSIHYMTMTKFLIQYGDENIEFEYLSIDDAKSSALKCMEKGISHSLIEY